MKKLVLLLKFCLLFFIIIVFTSCEHKKQRIVILSKDSTHAVRDWLTKHDSSLKIIEFYTLPKDSMAYYLVRTNGIIMCGGEDVDPELYGKPNYAEICGKIDPYRDSIEVILVKYAMKTNIPILGICRGHQILNVVNGGTLIPDIPTFIKDTSIHHRINNNGLHPIACVKNSWIDKQFREGNFMVNSRHHQSVDELAPIFKVAAKSPDGVVESIELKNKKSHSFVLGVQWHPENLTDPLSGYLRASFLKKVYKKT